MDSTVKKPILIISAMDTELSLLNRKLTVTGEYTLGDFFYEEGRIDGRDIVLCRCLVGKVFAAAAAMEGIRRYEPSVVITQGTAGAHDPSLEYGDIVVVKKAINIDRSNRDTTGYPSSLPDCAKWIYPSTEMFEDGGYVYTYEACSDEELAAIAMDTVNGHGKVIEGVTATSDAWNQDIRDIEFYHRRFGSSCEDMESFSVMKIAEQFKVPCIGIRVISNSRYKAGESVSDVAFEKYGTYCQEFVAHFISKLK